jgi:hypothetical protein
MSETVLLRWLAEGSFQFSAGFWGLESFGGSETCIRIHKTCFVAALKYLESAESVTLSGDDRKVATDQPIVFHISENVTSAKLTIEKEYFDNYGHQ